MIVAQALEGILRLGDLAVAECGDGSAVLIIERENVVVFLLLVESLRMGGEILANALTVD